MLHGLDRLRATAGTGQLLEIDLDGPAYGRDRHIVHAVSNGSWRSPPRRSFSTLIDNIASRWQSRMLCKRTTLALSMTRYRIGAAEPGTIQTFVTTLSCTDRLFALVIGQDLRRPRWVVRKSGWGLLRRAAGNNHAHHDDDPSVCCKRPRPHADVLDIAVKRRFPSQASGPASVRGA